MGACPYIVQMLRTGLRLQFLSPPPLVRVPIFMESYQGNVTKSAALRDSVEELLEKGVLEEVTNHNSSGFYGRLFLRPKPDGTWRKVIDLSGLNDYIYNTSFHMETVMGVQSAMRASMWVSSIDLSDAYYHLLIHPKFRKYLRVALLGRVFQFRAMPMGLNVAARVFTKVVLEPLKKVREQGISLHAYLDDWMIKGYCKDTVERHTKVVVEVCHQWGLLINLKKSELRPVQRMIYLGVDFDLEKGLAIAPLPRLEDLESLILKIYTRGGASARSWHSLLGKMGSLMRQIHLGPLRRRPIQRFLRSRWSQESLNWEFWVRLESPVKADLDWWLDRRNTHQGVPLAPFCPGLTLFTDASVEGFGASLGDREMGGDWTREESQLHSNNRELLAVSKAVVVFGEVLRNQQVLICSDNTATVAAINHQGSTKSESLMALVWDLWGLLDERECVARARHIPGRLNVLADSLSRRNQVIPTEWSILGGVLDWLWRRWPKPEIDLFATHKNYKMMKFVSPFPHHAAWRVNAFSFCWTGLSLYAFPPWVILGEVLAKIRDDGANVVLVAPGWTARPWYPLLIQMSVEDPVTIPLEPGLLVQTHSGVVHQDPRILNLQAWRLSGLQ